MFFLKDCHLFHSLYPFNSHKKYIFFASTVAPDIIFPFQTKKKLWQALSQVTSQKSIHPQILFLTLLTWLDLLSLFFPISHLTSHISALLLLFAKAISLLKKSSHFKHNSLHSPPPPTIHLLLSSPLWSFLIKVSK